MSLDFVNVYALVFNVPPAKVTRGLGHGSKSHISGIEPGAPGYKASDLSTTP